MSDPKRDRRGDRLRMAVIPRLGYAYIRLLRATMRLEYRNREVLQRVRESHGQYILVFWHSRFAMMPYCYPGGRLAVLSSQHRDSLMLSRILERFGLTIVPGSSTAGGARGLRNLLQHVRDGYDMGITPDGPRGPRRRIKSGAVVAAKLSGLPLIPVTFSARPSLRVRSWDRTLVPRPFGTGLFRYGEPIEVPRRVRGHELERIRLHLEQTLDRLTDEVDREVGIPVEEPRPPVRSPIDPASPEGS